MDYQTKIALGVQNVFDFMTPLSGVGITLLRELRPHSPEEKDSLLKDYDEIAVFVDMLCSVPQKVEKIKTALMRVKDIKRTFCSLGDRDPDETELFEIKTFCRVSDEIKDLLLDTAACPLFPLDSLGEPLSLLGSGEGFYIDSSFSKELETLRLQKEKTLVDAEGGKKKNVCLDDEQAKRFEEEHLRLAAEEYKIFKEILADLGKKLAPYKQNFSHNLLTIGKLDLAIQKAILARKYKLTRPVISDELELRDAIHPLVADTLQRKGDSFCPISIKAQKGVTVVTGANMGGKTVALKTVGLNAALALYGFYVFASYCAIPMFCSIEVAALDAQNVEKGLSSFGADVVRLDSIYRSRGEKKRLILSDEFASGTNAAEGSAIFRAFARAFMESNDCVIMTTHFDGVCDFVSARYQVKGLKTEQKNAIARAGIDEIKRCMDYGLVRIEKGAPLPRDAIKICALLGLSPEILDNISVDKGENDK